MSLSVTNELELLVAVIQYALIKLFIKKSPLISQPRHWIQVHFQWCNETIVLYPQILPLKILLYLIQF